MGSVSKKRNASMRMFDVLHKLDSQDKQANRGRRTAATDRQRSLAAQSQTRVYHKCLESRILLQRPLQADIPENAVERQSAVEVCNALLVQLIHARRQLAPDKFARDNSNLADIETKVSAADPTEFHNSLQLEHEVLENEWETVFNRRHKDVRLQNGQAAEKSFRVVDASFWQQVVSTTQYEESKDKEFDDSKVYQHLLKDFCTSSTANISGSTAPLKAKRSSKSTRKQVDRRASKGRKVRYTAIPKLVNFTFPLSRPDTGSLDQDAWFQSLLGGVAHRT
jgi:hypothetical protein